VKLRYNRERGRERVREKRIGGEKDSNSGTLQLGGGGICVGPAPFVLPLLITLLLEGKMDHGASTYHVLCMEERNGSVLPLDNDVCAGL
jgi:hypothetical protein